MPKKICVITIHDVSAFQSHLSKTIETMKQIDVNGVANLIMIGNLMQGHLWQVTAISVIHCKRFNRPCTCYKVKVSKKHASHYYTIAGNWNPLLILNCPQPDWFPIEASLFPKLPRLMMGCCCFRCRIPKLFPQSWTFIDCSETY